MVRVSRHVLRARHVHTSTADVAWHACIRLGRELPPRDRRHFLNCIENDLRADRAVEADDVGAERVERPREIFGRHPVRSVAVRADCHLRDDGNSGIDFARRENRLFDLMKIGERLEEEDVAAGILEWLQLLAECGTRFVEAGWTKWLDTQTQWTDRASHE